MTYGYDADSRLTSVTDNAGATALSTSYSYDAAGRLDSYVYPNGVATSLTYDKLNRLMRIPAIVISKIGIVIAQIGPS